MSESPDGRPTPTPRPRPTARPSPRPRVAGSRREREDADAARAAHPESRSRRAHRAETAGLAPEAASARPRMPRKPPTSVATAASGTSAARRLPALALVLTLLCLAAAAGVCLLLWQRLNPAYVDSAIFAATRDGVRALYAYDYKDSEGSVQGKLDVLTGDLHDQYAEDLGQGGIIDTYEQVSATTSYEVLEVGLQQVNEAQDTATLVVFGQYVVTSVNSGDQAAPEGSECLVTPDGAQSCTQTVRVRVVKADGDWKIDELTLLTTS